MGNILASEVPINVSNIETYFDDVSGIKFLRNIWRTRFLKTVHARLVSSSDSTQDKSLLTNYDHSHLIEVVAKVFIFNIMDSSIALPFKVKLADQRLKLNSIPSCAPYQVTLITNRAAILIRQYFYESVYDRLSTRPFLSKSEKLWVIFLLLQCIDKVHEAHVIHGDLKLENIMITTWNWLVVTDFSSAYKPAILSLENPTPNFNYFFDTSRRRNCYLAPERFASSQINSTYNPELVSAENNFHLITDNGFSSNAPNESSTSFNSKVSDGRSSNVGGGMAVDFQLWTNKHTTSMDLFSLGCCIYEIYTDGKVLFDFSQLLQYKNNPKIFTTICNRIDNMVDDKYLAETIKNLIDISPTNRSCSRYHLEHLKHVLFPSYFYSVIYGFHRKFATLKSPLPDDWIDELALDAPLLVDTLEKLSTKEDNGHWGYINTLPIVTSNIRRLSRVSSKLNALKLLLLWSSKLSSPFILERILPYVLFFVNDKSDYVRSQIPSMLVQVLSNVNLVDKFEDVNIFNDYIIPRIALLASDNSYVVRLAFAKCLGKLCEAAFKLWDCSQIYRNLNSCTCNDETNKLSKALPINMQSINLTNDYHHQIMDGAAAFFFDTEIEPSFLNENLLSLTDNITQLTTTLLCDKSTTIKRVLLEDSFVTICVEIFQRQMVTDIISGSNIILHAISVLNDQIDFAMREAFFKIIPDLVEQLGAKLLSVVLPFIEQGLSDFSDWVVTTATESLMKICLTTSIPQDQQINLFGMILPFLSHPNLLIRKTAAETLYVMITKFDFQQFDVYIMDAFSTYIDLPSSLVANIISCKERFFEFCKTPIPKWVFELLLKSAYTSQLFDFVKQVVYFEESDDKTFSQQLLSLLSVQIEPVVNLINRIGNAYLRNQTEYKHLLMLSDYIVRLNKLKSIIGVSLISRRQSKSSNETSLDDHPKSIRGILNLNELVERHPNIIHNVELPKKGDYTSGKNKIKVRLSIQKKDNSKKPQYLSQLTNSQIDSIVRYNHEYLVTQYSLMLNPQLSDEQRFLNKIAMSFQPKRKNHRVSTSVTSTRSLNFLPLQKNASFVTDSSLSSANFNDKLSGNHKISNQIHGGNTWKICHRIHSIKSHSNLVAAVATSRHENLYASASHDGNVHVYDLTYSENGTVNCNTILTYERSAGRVNSVQFLDSPNYGDVLCCCSCIDSQDIHIIDLQNNLRQKIVSHSADYGYFVDICSLTMMNIPFILAANVNGVVNGYDMRIQSNQVSLSFTSVACSEKSSLTKMTVDPKGAWIACGDIQGRIHMWDVRFGCHPVYSIDSGAPSSVHSLSVHPSKSNLIISAHKSTDRIVKLWDLADGSLEKAYVTDRPLTNYGLATTVYNKENYAIFGGSDMCLRSWNLDMNRHSCILAVPESTLPSKTTSRNNYDVGDIDDCDDLEELSKTTYYDFIKSKFATSSVDTTIEKKIQYKTELDSSYHLSNAFPNRLNTLTSSIAIRNIDSKQSRILLSGCSDGTVHFYYLK